MLKIVQPLVVKDDGEVVELQLLLANEARLYSGRLKSLQGARTFVCRLCSCGCIYEQSLVGIA